MKKNKLTRRDFLKLAGVTSASLALSACGVKAIELPTATLIPPTGTPLPTETLTPTLTSTPILPLEQLPQTKQALTEFAQAFKAVGVNVTSDKLLQKGLEIRTMTGKEEKQYNVAFAHIEDSVQQVETIEGDYPVMIKTQNLKANEWFSSPLSFFANELNINIGMNYRFTLPQRNIPLEIDLQARDIAIRQGNAVVLDEGLKWWYLYPKETDLNTPRLDHIQNEIKNVLENNPDALIIGHPLIDGSGMYKTGWLEGKTMMELTTIIQKHVENMVVNNPQIQSWCVALEVGDRDDNLYGIFGGSSYVEIAASTARKANPNAYLFIDMVLPFDKVDNKTYELLSDLHTKGLIDGLGFQIDSDPTKPFDKNSFVATIKKYASLGISIDITSFNIKLRNLQNTPESEREKMQAFRAREILSAILDSEVVKNIILWETNYPDQYNWLERNYKLGDKETDWNSPNLDATLYRLGKDGKTIIPNVAYYAFLKTLFDFYSKYVV